MKRFILFLLLIFSIALIGCGDDPSSPKSTEIRLKTGSGLNPGAVINFMALSKDDNFMAMSANEIFAYSKTDADWYIDGDVIPFTTDYKKFGSETGEFNCLIRASGVAVSTKIDIETGKQTCVFSATQSAFSITVERP